MPHEYISSLKDLILVAFKVETKINFNIDTAIIINNNKQRSSGYNTWRLLFFGCFSWYLKTTMSVVHDHAVQKPISVRNFHQCGFWARYICYVHHQTVTMSRRFYCWPVYNISYPVCKHIYVLFLRKILYVCHYIRRSLHIGFKIKFKCRLLEAFMFCYTYKKAYFFWGLQKVGQLLLDWYWIWYIYRLYGSTVGICLWQTSVCGGEESLRNIGIKVFRTLCLVYIIWTQQRERIDTF
jgi:hypothetical protein